MRIKLVGSGWDNHQPRTRRNAIIEVENICPENLETIKRGLDPETRLKVSKT